MSVPDPELVKAIISATDGVSLSDASAKRIARSLQGTRRMLDSIEPKSMFDTEPAQFVRALESLAGRSDRNG